MSSTLDARELSSRERAQLTKLMQSIQSLLEQTLVQRGLALINKGTITFVVRDGLAIEIQTSAFMRAGKELPR